MKTKPVFFSNCEHRRLWTETGPVFVCGVLLFTMRLKLKRIIVKKGLSKSWGSLSLVPYSTWVSLEDGSTVVSHYLKRPEERDRRAPQPLPKSLVFWKPGRNEVWEKSDLMTTREVLLVYGEVSVWKIRSIKCLYSLLRHDLGGDEIVKRWLT